MRLEPVFKTLFMLGGFAACTLTHGQADPLQWDRESAMAAVHSVNINLATRELGDISTLGNAEVTLEKLRGLVGRRDWPLPAREAVLFRFVQSLAELPRDAVATEVMQYLDSYQARTLVPHEDHAEASVPLFNIRAVAVGVENGWQRSEYAIQAHTLLGKTPSVFVSNYIKFNDQNQRSGYLDALRQARPDNVAAVQEIVLEQAGKSPGLTDLLAATAVITMNGHTVKRLLTQGRGAGMSPALVQLGRQLPPSETAQLLTWTIKNASAVNASLAIAAWWPYLSHDTEIRQLMLATLSDPVLGSSAALALAQAPDIQTIRALKETAKGTSTAARRAQMALDINRSGLVERVHP